MSSCAIAEGSSPILHSPFIGHFVFLLINNLFSPKASSFANSESIWTTEDLVQSASEELEAQLSSIVEKLSMSTLDFGALELRQMVEQQLGIERCLRICALFADHTGQLQFTRKSSDSRSNRLRHFSNYGTGDAMRLMVPTSGDKNQGMEDRQQQVAGYLSDKSVQQLSQDFARDRHASLVPNDRAGKTHSEFFARYGPGRTLRSAREHAA